MHKFILTSFFFFSFGLFLTAQERTFNVDYTYNLSDLDSKVTAEVIALYSAKNNLILNINHFIDSTSKSKPELQNDIELSSDRTISLIHVIVETSIIEKNWSPDKSYIELECNFDFELFITRLEKTTRIKEEIDRIIKLKNRSDKANIQIETIRSKADSVDLEVNKFKLQLEYFNNINVLKELEYFQKGYSAYLRKDYNISISYLTKMIELNPDNDFGYYNLALIYSAQGNDEDAVKYYRKTLKVSPSFAEANYNLGILYAKMGNEYNANRYLQKAARLNHKKAKKLLGPD